MARQKKPRRRRSGFLEGNDQLLRLNSLYRGDIFGGEQTRQLAQSAHAQLDDVSSPDPGEDLDDSELSDRERREAISRERTRREGLG